MEQADTVYLTAHNFGEVAPGTSKWDLSLLYYFTKISVFQILILGNKKATTNLCDCLGNKRGSSCSTDFAPHLPAKIGQMMKFYYM